MAPLVLVLCEIKLPPILSIAKSVPAIQDRLRRIGYPMFDQQNVQELQLSGDQAQFNTAPRFLFSTRDRDSFVALTQSSLVFEVLSYSGFEDFLKRLRAVVEILASEVEPSHYERLGLRYVDLVESDTPDQTHALFDSSILSLSAEELGVDEVLINTAVFGTAAKGSVAVRLSQTRNGSTLPADLLAPELAKFASASPKVQTFLDIDGSKGQSDEFSPEGIIEDLWAVHDMTEKAFWRSITSRAQEQWGMMEMPAEVSGE